MPMQRLAEFPGEAILVLARQGLAAKYDREIFVQRAADFRELGVGDVFRQIDSSDLGTDGRTDLTELNRLIGLPLRGIPCLERKFVVEIPVKLIVFVSLM